MRTLYVLVLLGWGSLPGCSTETPCSDVLQFIIDNCGRAKNTNLDPDAKPSCAPLQLRQAENKLACYANAADVRVVCAIELAEDYSGLDADEFERVSDCLAAAFVKE